VGCLQALGRLDAGLVCVLQQRTHVAQVGPDRVRRQGAFGPQVALEGGQGGGRSSGGGQGGYGGGDPDPWASDSPGGFSDEPPF